MVTFVTRWCNLFQSGTPGNLAVTTNSGKWYEVKAEKGLNSLCAVTIMSQQTPTPLAAPATQSLITPVSGWKDLLHRSICKLAQNVFPVERA